MSGSQAASTEVSTETLPAETQTSTEKTPASTKVETPAPAPEKKVEPSTVETKETTLTQKAVAPEKYDLKLPENSLLDPTHVEKISSYAKEKGLSNEQAQEILNRENEVLTAYDATQKETYNKIKENWRTEAEADKEVGGEQHKESVHYAQQVVNRFGSDVFKKALVDTGFGNHPELLRIFARIGRVMSPDKLVLPGTQPVVGTKKSVEAKLYDHESSKTKE